MTKYGDVFGVIESLRKYLETKLASAKIDKDELILSEYFDALDVEDSYQLGQLNGEIGALEELLKDFPLLNFVKKGE
jgi:hypothetical protein